MNAVIVGDWSLSEERYLKIVPSLLQVLSTKYPDLVIYSAGCDRSIGKIVKNACLSLKTGTQLYDFVEISAKVFSRAPLSKATLSEIWRGRSAALAEVGDEFHLFLGAGRNGVIQDLRARVVGKGMPFALYAHDEELNEPKEAEFVQEVEDE
jgi:hypothetical protein